jgi:ABC-type transporter MlaC component
MAAQRGRRSTIVAALVLVLGGVAAPARGQGSSDAEKAVATVLQQLEAFRRNDFDAAYTFASAMIHQIFDRQRFEAMVRGGYPEIAHSTRALVLDRKLDTNGSVYVRLEIRGANGKIVDAIYELVWEDGAWKINAVVTRPVEGVLSLARARAR